MSTNYDLIMRNLREKYKQTGVSDNTATAQASFDVSKQNQNALQQASQNQFTNKVEENTKSLYEQANWWQKLNIKVGQYVADIGYGFAKSFENILDFGTNLVGGGLDLIGADNAAEKVKDFSTKDLTSYLYENPVTEGIYGLQSWTAFGENYNPWEIGKTIARREAPQDWGDKVANVVGGALGQYALASGASSAGASVGGKIGASAGASSTGIANAAKIGARAAQDLAMFSSAAGGASTEALAEGHNYGEALGYGALSGAIEVGTERFVDKGIELVRSGLGKMVSGADKLFTSGGSTSAWFTGGTGTTNLAAKLITEFDEEGWEEVVGDVLEPLAKMVTTDKGKTYGEIFQENGGAMQLVEDYILGGIGGAFMGGTQYVGNVAKNGKVNVKLQGYLEQIHNINQEIQTLTEKDSFGSNADKIQTLELKKQVIQNRVNADFNDYLKEQEKKYDDLANYGIQQQSKIVAERMLNEESAKENPNLEKIAKLNVILDNINNNPIKKPSFYDELTDRDITSMNTVAALREQMNLNNPMEVAKDTFRNAGLESTSVASTEDIHSSADKISNEVELSRAKINNPIVENGKPTYDKSKGKNMVRTTLHELFHISSRADSKNIVDIVLKDIDNTPEYNSLYENVSKRYEGKYSDEQIKGSEYWDLVAEDSTLTENQRIAEAKRLMLREEIAADRFGNMFNNIYEFKKAIKTANFRSLFEMQNLLSRAFEKGKNRAKPSNYYEIMNSIKNSIEETERIAKEKVEKKLEKPANDVRLEVDDLEPKKQLLFEEVGGKLYIRDSLNSLNRRELKPGDTIALDYINQKRKRIIGSGDHRYINALNTGHGHYAYVDRNGNVQLLQPEDVWKLQGFTMKDFDKAVTLGKASANDIYRITGNSMTKYVMEAVLSELPLEKNVKIIEYFGGIGAPRMALRDLGYKVTTVEYRENNKKTVKLYNAIHGENFKPTDIRDSTKVNVQADVLIHGSPCVDYSNLKGKRRKGGLRESGSESALMWETIDRLYEMKDRGILPKYVIWENVSNVQGKKYQREFDSYIATIENIGYKYNVWTILNSIDFGVPQTRQRSFVVSSLEDIDYKFVKGNRKDTPDFIKYIEKKNPSSLFEKALKSDKRFEIDDDSDLDREGIATATKVEQKKPVDTNIIEIFNSVDNDKVNVSKIDSTYGRLKRLKSHFEKEAERHKKAPLGYSSFEEFKGQQVVTDAFLLGILSPGDMIPLGDVKKSEYNYPTAKPILEKARENAEIKPLHSADVNGILKTVNNVDKENSIFGILDTDTNTVIYFDKKLFKNGIELLNAKNEELSFYFSHNNERYGSSLNPILLQKNSGTKVLMLPVRMDERSSISKVDDVALYNLKTSEAFIPRAKYEDLIDLEATKEIIDKVIANEKNKKVPKQFEETIVESKDESVNARLVREALNKATETKTREELTVLLTKVQNEEKLSISDLAKIQRIGEFGIYETKDEHLKRMNAENLEKEKLFPKETKAIQESLDTLRSGGKLKSKYDYVVGSHKNGYGKLVPNITKENVSKIIEIRDELLKEREHYLEMVEAYEKAISTKTDLGDNSRVILYDGFSDRFTERIDTLNAKIREYGGNVMTDTSSTVSKNVAEDIRKGLSVEEQKIYDSFDKEIKDRLSKVESERNELKANIKGLSEQLKTAETTIKDLKAKGKETKQFEDTIQALKTELEQKRYENKILYNKLRFLKTRYNDSRANLWEKIKANQVKSRDMESLRNQLTKTEDTAAKNITKLIAMHNKAEQVIETLRNENQFAEEQLGKAIKENAKLENEIRKVLKREAKALENVEKYKNSFKELKAENRYGWKLGFKAKKVTKNVMFEFAKTFSNMADTDIDKIVTIEKAGEILSLLNSSSDNDIVLSEAQDKVLDLMRQLTIDFNGTTLTLGEILDGSEESFAEEVELFFRNMLSEIKDGRTLSDMGVMREKLEKQKAKYKERVAQFAEYRYTQSLKNSIRRMVERFTKLKDKNKFGNTNAAFNEILYKFMKDISTLRDNKKIKENMVFNSISDFVDSIRDLSTKNGKIEDSFAIEFPEELLDLAVEISSEENDFSKRLQWSSNFLTGLKRYILDYTGQALRTLNGKSETLEEWSEKGIAEMRNIKERKWNPLYSTLAPRLVFNILANGKTDSVLNETYNELEKGQNNLMESYVTMYDSMQKFAKTKNGKYVFNSLAKKGNRSLVTLEYGDGKTITARPSQLLSFVELSKREHAKESLAKMGVTFVGVKPIVFSPEAKATSTAEIDNLKAQAEKIANEIKTYDERIKKAEAQEKKASRHLTELRKIELSKAKTKEEKQRIMNEFDERRTHIKDDSNALREEKQKLIEQRKNLEAQQNDIKQGSLQLAEEEIDSLVASINDYFDLENPNSPYSEYIAEVEKFFEIAKDYKRVTDYQVKGFTNVEEGIYFPITTSSFNLSDNLLSGNFDSSQMLGALDMSFNHDIQGMGVVEVRDIEHVVENHLKNMSIYVGYAPVLDTFSKIYNIRGEGSTSFGKALESTFVADNKRNDTQKPKNYLIKLFKDLQAMKTPKGNTDKIIDNIANRLRNNVATVSLFFNFKVMVSQLASIPAALKYLGGKNIVAGIGLINSNKVPEIPKSAIYRSMNKSVLAAETLDAKTRKFTDLFGKGITWFDKQAIRVIWASTSLSNITLSDGTKTTLSKEYDKLKTAKATNTDVETAQARYDEAYEIAKELFNKNVNETQPNYNPLGRSELMRTESPIGKLFIMFKSQASQNWSNAAELYYMIKQGKTKVVGLGADDKKARRMLAGLIVQAIVYTLIGQIFRHINNGDWENMTAKSEAKNFGTNFLNENLLGMIPLLDQLEFDLSSKYKITPNLSTGWLGTYTEAVNNALDGNANAQDLIRLVSYSFGIPLTNLYKYSKTFVQYVAPDFAYTVDSWYTGKTTSTKSAVNTAIDTSTAKGESAYKKYSNSIVRLNDTTLDTMYSLYRTGYKNEEESLKVALKTIPSSFTIDGVEYPVDSAKFKKDYSKVTEPLSRLTKSTAFTRLSQEEKATAINYLLNTYYSLAKHSWRESIGGEGQTIPEMILANNYKLSVKHVLWLSKISCIESDEKATKKEKIQAYINKLNVRREEKYFLFLMSGYSLSEEKLAYVKKYLISQGFSYRKIKEILGI